MSAEFLRTLLDYNTWANIRVFDRAVAVPESEVFRDGTRTQLCKLARDLGTHRRR